MANICLDFDGVLHDHLHPAPGKRMGPPMPGALEGVRRLNRQGHELTIHTARCTEVRQLVHIYDWLDFFGFPRGIDVCIAKPNADVYVDDRGLHHWDWESTLTQLCG